MESESCTGLIVFTWIASTLVALFVGYLIGLRDNIRLTRQQLDNGPGYPRENRRRP